MMITTFTLLFCTQCFCIDVVLMNSHVVCIVQIHDDPTKKMATTKDLLVYGAVLNDVQKIFLEKAVRYEYDCGLHFPVQL